MSCTGTLLIPIIILAIINTISNLPVYEIQLLDNTHGTNGTCNYACLLAIHKLHGFESIMRTMMWRYSVCN